MLAISAASKRCLRTEVPRVTHPDDAPVAARQFADRFLAPVGAVIVDEDDFVLDLELVKHGTQAVIHDRNRLIILVAGDDCADAVLGIQTELLRRRVEPFLVLQAAIPLRGAGEAVVEVGGRRPSQTIARLGGIREPLAQIPSSIRHGSIDRGCRDTEELARRRGDVSDRRFPATTDVEGFTEIFVTKIEGRGHESLTDIVHVNEITRDLGVDQLGVSPLRPQTDQGRNQPRRILQRPVHRVEPQVRARQSLLFAPVMEQVGTRCFGDRVVAVGRGEIVFARSC